MNKYLEKIAAKSGIDLVQDFKDQKGKDWGKHPGVDDMFVNAKRRGDRQVHVARGRKIQSNIKTNNMYAKDTLGKTKALLKNFALVKSFKG